MLNSVKISLKLPVVIVSLCILVGASISLIAYQQSRQAMLDEVSHRIDVLMKERAAQLRQWSQTVENDIRGYGTDPTVAGAITGLSAVFSLMSDDPTRDFQRVYIEDNPYPVGEREKLVKPDVAHPYHVRHGDIHPFFVNLKNTDRYYDIFLFDLNGNLVYSVYKELDFATNFVDGEFSDSGLGRAFRQALELPAGEIAVIDFSPYAPSYGAPAAFISTPAFDEFGTLIGVFAVQLPLDILTEITNNPAGLGDTGEIFVTNLDGELYSESRFENGPALLSRVFKPENLQSFRDDPETVLVDVKGYHASSVLSLAEYVTVFGLKWEMIAEIDLHEALEPAYHLRNMMVIIGLVGICAAGAVGLYFSATVTRPLSRFHLAMEKVAQRAPDVNVSDTERGDEIGAIAQTLLSFKDQLDASDLQAEKNQQEHDEQARVVGRLNVALLALADGDLTANINTPFAPQFEDLRNNFNQTIEQLAMTVKTLVETAGSIQLGAHDLADGSRELSQRTESQAATLEQTAAALDELTGNVQSVASGAKEAEGAMALAKSEALDGSPVVKDAVAVMTEIETSSRAISDIVNVINDIAFQTNLLALNAGVEAARAGDAGRGFAVVAAEVQALSQRTTEASRQIGDLISGSADNVARGVNLVGAAGETLTRIVDRVTQVADLMGNIATSVRDQASAMGEINIGMTSLDQVTQQNAAMVETTNQNSQTLSVGAQKLTDAAGQFQINSEEQRFVDAA